jgi:hypothetical protein
MLRSLRIGTVFGPSGYIILYLAQVSPTVYGAWNFLPRRLVCISHAAADLLDLIHLWSLTSSPWYLRGTHSGSKTLFADLKRGLDEIVVLNSQY